VIVLGNSGVGKTSVMQKYISPNAIIPHSVTVGTDFLSKSVVVGDIEFVLQIWDTAGQERFQSLGVAYYRDASYCILVFDVNVSKTFEDLSGWKDEFLIQASPSDPKNFPFVVVGNKTDIDLQRVVSHKRANTWCQRNGSIPYFETSAMHGANIEEPFKWIVEHAVKQYKEDGNQPGVVNVRVGSQQKKGFFGSCNIL